MHANQFDGNAAFAGGGFMPSQTNQGGESSLTPSKNRESQTLLPLTIKQINHALQSSDDRTGLTIDGVGVNTVTLVGRVCNKSGQITEFKFVLDDGTGTIECTKWLHEPADAMAVESILNGMYVRLYGQLKGFQGKTLSIFSLRPVTDFNEIASHFIECIYVHLYNSRLQHTQASIPSQQHAPNSIQITPTKGYQAQAIPPNQFSGQHNNGQKSVQELVLEYLALPTIRELEGGVFCGTIAKQLGVSLDNDVIPALDLLSGEGVIYEGLPKHYKICSDG